MSLNGHRLSVKIIDLKRKVNAGNAEGKLLFHKTVPVRHFPDGLREACSTIPGGTLVTDMESTCGSRGSAIIVAEILLVF